MMSFIELLAPHLRLRTPVKVKDRSVQGSTHS